MDKFKLETNVNGLNEKSYWLYTNDYEIFLVSNTKPYLLVPQKSRKWYFLGIFYSKEKALSRIKELKFAIDYNNKKYSNKVIETELF